MDVLKRSPTKTNNPSLTSTNASHIASLQSLHQALNEDQTDDVIVENLVRGLTPYFEQADALFLYEKVHGEIKLTAQNTNVREMQPSILDLDIVGTNATSLLSWDAFEDCGCHDYLTIDYIHQNNLFIELSNMLARANINDCLLVPVCVHDNVVAVLVVMSRASLSYDEIETVETCRALLTNLVLMLQKRNRAKLQAQLQTQLLGFRNIDETLSNFAELLLSHEDSIFQIQVLSLEDNCVCDFHVYGQMLEFEDQIKENILSKGNIHISFNKTLEQAAKTKSSIYTPDVFLDPNWPGQSYSKTRSIIYFPLYNHAAEVVGIFCAISDKVNGFSSSDQRFLQETMGAVNLVFQNHYQISDLEENVLQLGQLADFSQALQNTNSVNEAQLKSLQVIMQETSASSCFFIEYNKEEKYFTIKARATGQSFSLALEEKVVPDETILAKHLNINTHMPLHMFGGAIEIFKTYIDLLGIQEDIQEVIICPLVLEDSIVTELAVIATEQNFSPANLSLAKTIISSYGNCIRRIESVEFAKNEAKAYKTLAGFGAQIEEIQNFDELIDYGIQQLMSIFGLTDANYYVVTDNNELVINAKSWGTELFSKEYVTVSESPILNSVIASKQLYYVQDYPNHEKSIPTLIDKGLRSLVFVPVEYANKVVGCMALHGMHDMFYLNESDLDLVRQFLSRLRNALERNDYIHQLEQSREDTLRSLGIVLEHRDLETQGHTDRVVTLSRNFAKQIRLSNERVQELIFGAYLHDIGKLAIPDRILLKPGKLTNEEFDEIKTHAVRGYDMANNIPLLSEASSLLVRHHHEQWQGSGYPDNLQRDEIPFLARMFTLVDVYDALRSHRPYKKAWTKEECFTELRDKSGIMFDPDLVEEFIIVADDFDDAYQNHNLQQESSDLFSKKQELMFAEN